MLHPPRVPSPPLKECILQVQSPIPLDPSFIYRSTATILRKEQFVKYYILGFLFSIALSTTIQYLLAPYEPFLKVAILITICALIWLLWDPTIVHLANFQRWVASVESREDWIASTHRFLSAKCQERMSIVVEVESHPAVTASSVAQAVAYHNTSSQLHLLRRNYSIDELPTQQRTRCSPNMQTLGF